MKTTTFCICETKDADQLCSYTAEQINAFVFATTIVQFLFSFLIRNFKILDFFCSCTGRFVSDLVGNPKAVFLVILRTKTYEPPHGITNNLHRQKQRHMSAFVFASRIVQFLYFLNPKFPTSNHLL